MKLVPALVYKEEIEKKSAALFYSEKYFLYLGCLSSTPIFIEEEDESGEIYQYAIVDDTDNQLDPECKEEVVGYVSFHVDWYASNVYDFGLLSFEDEVCMDIGAAVKTILDYIFKELNPHRIEWRMVGGNPVQKKYERLCRQHNGSVRVLTDAVRDRHGNYRNVYIYEIINGGQ